MSTEQRRIDELLNELWKKRGVNPTTSSSNAYNALDLTKSLPNLIASIWRDSLAQAIKAEPKRDKFKITNSNLLDTIQKCIYFSSLNGEEEMFWVKINDEFIFMNGERVLEYKTFFGKTRQVIIRLRDETKENAINQSILFFFDYESKHWSIKKVNSTKLKELKTLSDVDSNSEDLSDADKLLLGIEGDTVEVSFEGTPTFTWKNNANSESDTEQFKDKIEILNYLGNQVPETHDYERIKFELNLMFNAELDEKEEDFNLRNKRTSKKANQDERYSTATGTIQGVSTVLNIEQVYEKWFNMVLQLTKTPTFTGGLDGKNQKGSSEVVGADPIATTYLLMKLTYSGDRLKAWLDSNKKLKTLIGDLDKFEVLPSPLVTLKLRFIQEGIISSQESKRQNTNINKNDGNTTPPENTKP